MDLDRHDFQLDELVTRIKSNDHRLIALQVPEGLKMQALEMMDQIEDDSDAKVVLAADPCYGACDLVHDKMRAMGVELVAHMGHSQMNIDSGMPTQFISVTYDGEPEIEGVLPILRAHLSIAESRKGAERKNEAGRVFDRIQFRFDLALEGSPVASSTIIWHYNRGRSDED